jgi:hypothetical protein
MNQQGLDLFREHAFLRSEGPELRRSQESSIGVDTLFDPCLEHVTGWADVLATSGKGLTTLVRATSSN